MMISFQFCPRLRWTAGLRPVAKLFCRRKTVWPWVAALALTGLGVHATQQGPVAVEDMARQAQWIVHGKVESVETLLTPSGRRLTRVELVGLEVWKGSSTNRLGVVLASGVLGDRWVKVVGEPEYRPGEEVVVFARDNDWGEAVTLNLAQGKFAVEDAGKAKWVSNGVLGGSPTPGGARMPQQLPLRLESLQERVRTALSQEKQP
ncbi:MAG: hypothetical protein J0M24_23645 [Verrucomicrobia bacterium]|nr:hypothetical protein [Verrucomicrobiota bacterium]